MRSPFLPAVALTVCVAALRAQCPIPQPGFGPGGAGAPVLDFATIDLGNGPALYAAGRFSTIGDTIAKGVARWDGQSWSPLGDGIDVTQPSSFYLQQVGRVVPIDFGGPKLCALGNFVLAGGQAAHGIALWNGQQWDVLAGGPTPPLGFQLYLSAAAVFDEGAGPRLFVGGSLRDPETNTDPFFASFDGTSWTTIANGPTSDPCGPDPWSCIRRGSVSDLAVWDDGTGPALFLGGDFDRVNGVVGFNFARWNGSAWSFPNGVGIGGASGVVSEMVLHDDGSGTALYLSGGLTGAPDARVVRWNGTAYSALAPTGNTIFGEELVALPACAGMPAGLWLMPTSTSQDDLIHAHRWDGTSWVPFWFAVDDRGDTYALGAFDSGNGTELFLGGNYRYAGTTVAAGVARFDGAAWHAFGSGLGIQSGFDNPGYVSALCIHDDGTGPALYAGGAIYWSGGQLHNYLVRWNGTDWDPLPGLLSAGSSSMFVDKMVSADVGQGPSLYVSGNLMLQNGSPRPFMRWNGSAFDSAGFSTSTIYDMAAFDAGGGLELYVAMQSSLVRWDDPGATTIMFQSTSTSLRSLCVFDDGSGPALYVGGSFAGFGGASSRGIVRWNGTTWSPVGAGLGASQSDVVEMLKVVHIGGAPRLLAGGKFSVSGSTPVGNLALWDGVAWSDLGGGVGGTNVFVETAEEFDDGQGEGRVLFVGGRFQTAGGAPAANLARWNGQTWSPFDVGTVGNNPRVRALCAADLPVLGGRVLSVGGDFEAVGPVPAQRYARLAPCGQTGDLGCFGDGSSAACPCGNSSPVGAQAGCVNSLGAGSTLRAHGSSSLSNDTLVLDGGALPPSSGLYFQGAGALANGQGVAFGDGLRCLSGPYKRLGSKASPSGASSYPNLGGGDLSVSVKGAILEPGTAHYQIWYRNPAAFCTSATFNYTNTVAIVWGL